ncbi:MAG: GNAT family N-acetyltransferase [Chloroflexi bacterium]|nr:MAG: GNAT family N-acetyltransferase [Chloroflexota bacterium]MBL1196693.1 GNAT family N-acetyltransferase [Chloroflexota bacterium]NOH13986.1 GNAT family N-acetyltransferase [Chloroflexota bacterium]
MTIRVEAIQVKDLISFAEDVLSKAGPGDFIPITMQRAEAQANNPYAAPEDAALLVAYSGEELVGYFGILPIMLQHGNEHSKVHWFTTWMVNPKLRGAGVGSALMQAALDLDKDFMIVGSKPARRVCRKFGFFDFDPLEYAVVDFRIAGRYNLFSILLRAARKLLRLVGLKLNIDRLNKWLQGFFETLFGFLGKPFAYSLVKGAAKRLPPEIDIRQAGQIKPLPGKQSNAVKFRRSEEVVNWMLAYPWVLQPGESTTEAMDFYFTDTRPDFQYLAYELYAGEDYQGYLTFQLSKITGQRVLKVLDHSLLDEELLLSIALDEARKQRVALLEIAKQPAKSLRQSVIGRSLVQIKQRIYQGQARSESSPLGKHWREIELDYVDGDTPFT